MNKFLGIGRWAKPVELRYTPSGKPVSTSTIAINEGYGEKKTTTFLNVVIWNKLAEICAEHCQVGQQVAIEGKISVRSYEKDNRKVWVTEIVCDNVQFLSTQNSDKPQGTRTEASSGGPGFSLNNDPFADSPKFEITDDMLPF